MRLLRSRERRTLFRRRFFLMLGLPLRERLPEDALARLILAHVHAAFDGGFAVPVGQAIAAETGQYHQVDVLHVAAFLVEMSQQATKRRGFEFGGRVGHSRSPLPRDFTARAAAAIIRNSLGIGSAWPHASSTASASPTTCSTHSRPACSSV